MNAPNLSRFFSISMTSPIIVPITSDIINNVKFLPDSIKFMPIAITANPVAFKSASDIFSGIVFLNISPIIPPAIIASAFAIVPIMCPLP